MKNEDKLDFSFKISLKKEEAFFGHGIAALLLHTDELQSLKKASQLMGMAYSKAWRIVKAAEKELGFSLLDKHVGGVNGGGSELTEEGRCFVKAYIEFENEINQYGSCVFDNYFEKYIQKGD